MSKFWAVVAWLFMTSLLGFLLGRGPGMMTGLILGAFIAAFIGLFAAFIYPGARGNHRRDADDE